MSRQPEAFQDDVLGKVRGKLFRDGGISADKFKALQLDRQFRPITLAEMKAKSPSMFMHAGLSELKPIRTAWGKAFPDVVIDRPLGLATGNALYDAAKAGDPVAAYKLANELITDEAVARLKPMIQGKDVLIVPVHAEESAGTNQIPNAAAFVLGQRLGVEVDFEIVQAIKVSRTGGDGWHRLANAPYFDGQFESGRYALMVDDTLTQGGTFASLRGHIEEQGGHVLGAYALTGKQYSRQLSLSDDTLKDLRKGYGDIEEWWQQRFGYDFSRLTEWEARYILNSGKTPDTVRDSVAAAQQI